MSTPNMVLLEQGEELTTNSNRNYLNKENSKQPVDMEQLRNTGKLGVLGSKSWPIRILNLLFFGGTVLFIQLYGTRNAQVTKNYFLYVIPPGFFFSIWGLIFTLIGVVNLINVFKNIWTIREYMLLTINNILLILWTIVFDIGDDPSVFSSFLILLAIIPVGLYFWRCVGRLKPKDLGWFIYFSRNSFAFYLGWIIAATNLNLGFIIVYWWKASMITQMIIFWVMAPLCAISVTLLNLYLEGVFGLKCCLALWISVTWAFVGAGITSNKCINEVCP